MVFRDQRQAHQLNEIFGHDEIQTDILGNRFDTGSKNTIPDREDDAVIAVMFAPQSRVMGPMQRGGNQDVGDPFLVRNFGVRVVEQNKDQLDGLHGQDNVGIDSNENDEQALERNFD